MTDLDIHIEHEADLASSGEPKKKCPQCKTETYRKVCTLCTHDDGRPIALSGDEVLDDVERRIEAGEEVDLEEAFKVVRPGDIRDE